MAKNNNLTDFLTDVANAIREKKGSSDPINPQNFSDEIASIETGGGGGAAVVAESDVNFRDYDGTLLHSYTKSQFLALSELPELPSQPGLVCQEWNYTYEDAKSYVSNNGGLEIGATYVTNDGKTRLYINIAEKGRMTISVKFQQTKAAGVVLDWGDGSETETANGTGTITLTHTYSETGDFVISLQVVNGVLTLGNGSSSLLGESSSSYDVYRSRLKKVEMGDNAQLSHSTFASCFSLETITIPKGLAATGNSAFARCYSLKSLVLPQRVTTIGSNAISYCCSLKSVCIPATITTIGQNAFRDSSALTRITLSKCNTSSNMLTNCYSLISAIIPNGVTTIEQYTFYGCKSLKSVVIPNSVTSINAYAFQDCSAINLIVIPNSVTTFGTYIFQNCTALTSLTLPTSMTTVPTSFINSCNSLSSLKLPNSITSILSQAFYSCYGMQLYDFTSFTTIPTLQAANAFYNMRTDCKIAVPDALYDNWIAASNWSSWAANIVKASELSI